MGCWNPVRRKFVEASRTAKPLKAKDKAAMSKADVAPGKIRQLYAIEKTIKDRTPEQKQQARQTRSLPLLNEIKVWLDQSQLRVPKGSLTRKAIEYTLNQWPYWDGYCEDGRLNISNVKAENRIRAFAVGRKAWCLPIQHTVLEPVQPVAH